MSQGGNVIDSVRSLLFGVKDLSQKNRNFLKRYGGLTIQQVVLQREPVNSTIMSFLNVATLGGLKKALNNSKYESLFHLSVLLVLEGNVPLRVEKNEIITFSIQKKKLNKGAEIKPVSEFPPGIKLNDAIQKTKDAMGDKFATYDSKFNNCQNFILEFLHSNGVKDWYDDWVRQSVGEIFTANPWLRTITRAITDPAARVSNAVQGGQTQKKISLRKHGYHLGKPRGDRRKALAHAVDEYGRQAVIDRLMHAMELSKDEAIKNKYKSDIEALQ